MREVIIRTTCDGCDEQFTEMDEGSNSVKLTVYKEQREMDLCDRCIQTTVIQYARPVKGKKTKEFTCDCGKSFSSTRGLNHHKTRAHKDDRE